MHTNERGSKKRKPDQIEQSVSDDEPRRTRGIHTDYRYLNDPFPDKLEAAQITINNNITLDLIPMHTYAIDKGNCSSLKKVKASPEWPEWNQGIQSELN